MSIQEILGDRVPPFGYAVDVGAHDGIALSNSLWLEERDWMVLCVEGNPDMTERGRQNRKLWRDVAASNVDGEDQDFGIYLGAISYTSLGRHTRYEQAGSPPHRIVPVTVRTVDRLIHEAGFPRLDLLTIDVEGWEMEVIEGAKLDIWKPRFLIYEDYLDRYQTPAGYERLAIVGCDRVCERIP